MSQRHTRLQIAAQQGNLPRVQMLIHSGADLDCYHLSQNAAASVPPALYQAVCGGHIEVVQALVLSGAQLQMPCERWSLLHEAAGREDANLQMVALLVAAGCDPRAPALGQYAIDLAREMEHVRIIALLDAASGWAVDNL